MLLAFFFSQCKKNPEEEDPNWTVADQAYYEHILNLQNQGTDNLFTWLGTMDSLDAINLLHQYFLSDTSVAFAIVGSQGIAIEYKNGMRGGIMLDPKDSPDETEIKNSKIHEALNNPKGYKSLVNNKKMIFLNPHYFERSPWTNTSITSCTEFVKRIGYELNPIYKNDEVTLDRYCQLSGYGIIRIHAHGMAWPDAANIVETYLMSGEAANNATSKKYGDDIKAGNIIILNAKNVHSQAIPTPLYFISKDFITDHNDFSKDTVLFYGGFCYSFLGTWPLIEESCAKGTYLGFNWAVRTTFCFSHGDQLLDYLSDTTVAAPSTSGQFMGEPNPAKEYTKTENGVLITVKLLYSGTPDLTLWTKTLVTTNPVTDISTVSATSGGSVTAPASTLIEARGVCYSQNPAPTLNDLYTTDGTGTGSFTSSLDNLTPATQYHVRAYASLKGGKTIYGNPVAFKTSGGAVSVVTAPVTEITKTSAVSGGSIEVESGTSIKARGLSYGISPEPTLAGTSTWAGSGAGTFSSFMGFLSENTKYYVRAYATDQDDSTYYGNQVVFTTLASSFSIGQQYGGGIIFYIDNTGQHGLITDQYDVQNAPWGCETTYLGGTSAAFGTGQANSFAILAACAEENIAVRECDDLVREGYDDWYLPSLDEFSYLWNTGVVNFWFGNQYQTSTEVNATQNWTYAGAGYPASKFAPYMVRCIRTF